MKVHMIGNTGIDGNIFDTLCGLPIAPKSPIHHPRGGYLNCDACKSVIVELAISRICPRCGGPMAESTKFFWICLSDICFALFSTAETPNNMVVLPL